MTNNGKSFTYLFRRSSKTRIYIKRISIAKRSVQNVFLLTSFAIFGSLLGIGIYGVAASDTPWNFALLPSTITTTAETAVLGNSTRQTLDYSRPEQSDVLAKNSGGPLDADDSESYDKDLSNLLKAIQARSDPANIPAMWAHLGKINNEFGFRRNPFGGRTYEFHGGMDIDGERGDAVFAPANGVVSEAGWKGGYGNMIEIDHGNGLKTRYGHLSKIEVEAGQQITRGQQIGLIGSTGRSTGPHLHYELRINDHPINPRFFLPPEPTEVP